LLKMKTANKKFSRNTFSLGSALILTVVLTSLLAIVGVLFLMVSRVDEMATSAISENKELDYAVDTVLAKISWELVLDVPGVAGQEYYDYPDANNTWLAVLDPFRSNSDYYWRQISDVFNTMDPNLVWQAVDVPEYHDAGILGEGGIADADGDGVADSRWAIIPDLNSSKGKSVYAAIRIIDNGAMLNANTAYMFDPSDPNVTDIDGSSQMQINLLALAGRSGDPPTLAEQMDLLRTRANAGIGADPLDLRKYEQDIIWRYGEPNAPYTPFDISDELELRYRFLLNHSDIDTRLELWGGQFRKDTLSTPVTSGGAPLDAWFQRACDDGNFDPNYAYRHIVTTYNMDRIINPAGSKIVNVNRTYDPNYLEKLSNAIWLGLSDAGVNDNALAAQIAVNIKDYVDEDSNVTAYYGYYGFESPCIYISELVYKSVTTGDPPTTYRSYALELYNPYSEDEITQSDLWRLNIDGVAIDISSWPQGKDFYVVQNQDVNAPIAIDAIAFVQDSPSLVFDKNNKVELQRKNDGIPDYIVVDSIYVPDTFVPEPEEDGERSYQRDITLHKCIRRLWDPNTTAPTLGSTNEYVYPESSDPNKFIQAHPANRPFTNIGEIGMILRKSAYYDGQNPIGSSDTEATARLDLANPLFQRIFNYLTVFDPENYGRLTSETRIKGRININTAPWFVVTQLPWMQPSVAQAITLYRDKTLVTSGPDYTNRPGQSGFKSIAELIPIPQIAYYAVDPAYASVDLDRFPDLTPSDGAASDFEERDVIFTRISNLVTVRSDVFTAYILVRIGTDGPQKRVLAVLDRSQVTSPGDKVKILALQSVPDPR